MAVNFNKAGSMKQFQATKKVEEEKAQVVALQNIRAEKLLNNPENGEDITRTSDLEESMKQNGFTDPLEVTDFGMEEGFYMILSGHRRRAAAVKVFGPDFVFPCLVRHFKTEEEVQNYTLMANSQRDSAKDPCLFCTRYMLHERYLKSIGFKGSLREEIAKRLDVSVQQADRYKKMNDVILPVWDMVRKEVVGMSSVLPMGVHPENEQVEIYEIMQVALKQGATLTRETVKAIVDGYRAGKKTWAEIADLPRDSGLPLTSFINPDSGETREPKEHDRRDEGYTGYDPIAEAYDGIDADRKQWEQEQAENAGDEGDEQKEAETSEAAENGGDELAEDLDEGAEKGKKNRLTPHEEQLKRGSEIAVHLHKLDGNFSNVWKVEDGEAGMDMVQNMGSVAAAMISEMRRLADEWNLGDAFNDGIAKIEEALDQYK